MKKPWLIWLVPFALLAAACAPVARTVPAEAAVAYAGAPADVMTTVLDAIAAAPAISSSNGWVVTRSDAATGSIIAETDITTPAWFLRRESTRTERVVVVVTPAANGSDVVIQRTTGAESLSTEIERALRERFGTN
jgi:hypothetical protein